MESNKIAPKKYDVEKLKSFSTTSGKIRYLNANNCSRGEIVKIFKSELDKEIRYQHVRNVLITPITKAKE